MNIAIQLCFIRPGRPVENGFIESFNGRLRDECLNVEWFPTLEEARRKLDAWRAHYNQHRPHSALDDRPPAVFAALHIQRPKRFALSDFNKANDKPRQGLLRRLTPPLTRPAVCLKIPMIRAKRSYASLRLGTLY